MGQQWTVANVVDWVETAYPPGWAESWDAVGLVVGRPDRPVSHVRATVDVTESVVQVAIADGVDFLLAHHPLFLGGTASVAAVDAKGRLVHDLVEAGCALMVAHTNADSAPGGVSDALAARLGVEDTSPLRPAHVARLKLVVYVPYNHRDAVLDAASAAGAGSIGDYDRCAYQLDGHGTFRPRPGADPYLGHVGETEIVEEARIEMVLDAGARSAVEAAVLGAHPYEEPAYEFMAMDVRDRRVGLGRVGSLAQAVTVEEFAGVVADSLPVTAGGIRVAGDLGRRVRRVAVCGGSGDEFLNHATRAGADVYVTADLKHHRVLDHLADGGCAVIDVGHWASEWPWCELVASRLTADLTLPAELNNSGNRDGSLTTEALQVTVDRTVTDPWSGHFIHDESDRTTSER